MNFKLLGIRPLKGSFPRYTKVLNPGEIYPFYQGYQFYTAEGRELRTTGDAAAVIIPFDEASHLHDLLTADQHKIQVNISAVVGKNGSGKSTLMELFFAAIYLVSISDEILRDNPKNLRKELELLPGKISQWEQQWKDALVARDQLAENFNTSVKQKKVFLSFEEVAGQAALADELIKAKYKILLAARDREKRVRQQLQEMREMAQQLSAEIYYQVNRAVFCLSIVAKGGEPHSELYLLEEVDAADILKPQAAFERKLVPLSATVITKNFFYTIAINYSHYALNALHMGDWVNSLFHKNDGYKTPVVINPMRKKGNFDINTELALGKQRLLSNLLIQRQLEEGRQQRIALTSQLDIFRVWLTVDPDKVKETQVHLTSKGLAGPKRAIGLLEDIFEVFFQNKDFALRLTWGSALVNLALNYILEKIESIREYDGLGHYALDSQGRSEENRRYFKNLYEEPSHVTFKLKQALHFLRRLADPKWPVLFDTEATSFENIEPPVFQPTLEALLEWTGNTDGWEMINYLPPPIFKIDFQLIGKDGEPSFFNELSSGEQQMIHTLQTVLYHLNNLQSVRYSGLPRLHYRAINLVFDEIELYFHPAYQRSFISELRKALGRLYVGKDHAIEAINMVFLTHSPFILSDIPQNHITLLEVDKGTGTSFPSAPVSQTFAANINELLAGSFFLDGTLMGNFAESQVNDLISAVKREGRLNRAQMRLLGLIGDSYLQNSLKHFLNRKDDQNRIG